MPSDPAIWTFNCLACQHEAQNVTLQKSCPQCGEKNFVHSGPVAGLIIRLRPGNYVFYAPTPTQEKDPDDAN